MSIETKYGLQTTLDTAFEDAVEQVISALKSQGFGVLTEINMQQTLKQKLGVDTDQYVILGACNPSLAYQALQNEQEIGLLLPCNVIVYHDPTTAKTRVSIMNPEIMVQLTDNARLKDVADDAYNRLKHVIDSL